MPPSAVQSAVSINPLAGSPGMEYDSSFSDIVSWIATVAIPFGVLVYESAEGKASLPTATGNVTAGRCGIALSDPMKASQVGYEIGDAVRVMKRGRCWIRTEEALAFGDVMFARFAAGTGTQLGAFRNDADTGTCSTPPNLLLLRGGATNVAAVSIGDIT
jgi:hypothetical protein